MEVAHALVKSISTGLVGQLHLELIALLLQFDSGTRLHIELLLDLSVALLLLREFLLYYDQLLLEAAYALFQFAAALKLALLQFLVKVEDLLVFL